MGAPLPELQRGARGKWRRWRRARERRRQERRRGGARPRWRAAAALGEAREEARELLRLELGDELGRRFGGSLEKPSRRRKPREGRRLCCVWSSTATSGSAAPPSSSSSSTSRCSRVVVQFLCSYVTLPLYALVSQMGSTMKQFIFDEATPSGGGGSGAPSSSKNDTRGRHVSKPIPCGCHVSKPAPRGRHVSKSGLQMSLGSKMSGIARWGFENPVFREGRRSSRQPLVCYYLRTSNQNTSKKGSRKKREGGASSHERRDHSHNTRSRIHPRRFWILESM